MIQFFNKKLRNRKGFTLIELIVVIAILGILAAIAIPRFSGFRNKATDGADQQYGALVGNAIAVAMAEGSLVGPVDITLVASDGSYVVTPSGGSLGSAGPVTGGAALHATADARITNLVQPKPLADSANVVRVRVTAEGVVTVTVN